MSTENLIGMGALECKMLKVLLKSSVQEFLSSGVLKEFFVAEYATTFEFIISHIGKYKTLPSEVTLKEAGYVDLSTTEVYEPLEFYLDHIVTRHIAKLFNKTLHTASDNLKAKNLDGVAESFSTTLRKYEHIQRTKDKVINSNDLLSTYNKALINNYTTDGVTTPWPTANQYGPILRAGDLGVVAGRPASGKTWLQLVLAHHCSTVQKKKVLFISLEMSDEDLAFRYGSIEHGIDSTAFNKFEITTYQQKKITANKSTTPVIFLGNSVVRSLDTLRSDISIYQPDLVMIDAAYLLSVGKGAKGGMSKYDKISTTVQGLKEIATEFQIPVIASYQINREGKKAVSKGESLDLSHIAGSDDIPQLSTFVFLLDSVAKEATERTLMVGKNRKGTEDAFLCEWNLQTLSFGEIAGSVADESYSQKVG